MNFGLTDFSIWLLALITLGLTHVTIASVTIYLHRCQAHRSLTLHPAVAHFFRAWLWLTTGMATREWAAIHRKHHAKVETADDPHSPQIQGLLKVLFGGVSCYIREKNNPETVARYGYGTPDDWLERRVYSRHGKIGVTITLLTNLALFGPLGVLMWGVQMIWIPFWAAGVINGVGHYWGYRNFQPQDESRNIVPLGLLIGGEELHNNHHAFPTSAKLSNRWYEFDVGWLYIRLLEKAGLATVKRQAPRLLSVDSRLACDLDTLHSIVANRLEVATRFSQVMKKTCHDELSFMRAKFGNPLPTVRALNDWLHGMESRLSQVDKAAIGVMLENSKIMQKVSQMRNDLKALWEDKTLSAEQMVIRLREWCAHAEKSGIEALEVFARDLRGYRVSYA